jgi:hypothetical protein
LVSLCNSTISPNCLKDIRAQLNVWTLLANIDAQQCCWILPRLNIWPIANFQPTFKMSGQHRQCHGVLNRPKLANNVQTFSCG